MENVPKVAWLTVNRACDMRCKWCYAAATGYVHGSDMDIKLAKQIALLVKDVGVKTIILIGGEPTIWKSLFEFNDFCRSLNLRTILVTNGRRFRIERFRQEFQQHPTNSVAMSLKAFDEQSFLFVTGSKDFEGVKIGIKSVCDSSKTYISIVYSTLIQGQLIKMIEMAIKLGAHGVRISTCTPMSENGKFVAPYIVDYGVMVKEICDCYEKAIELTRGNVSLELKTPLCIWPRDFVDNLIEQNQIGSGCQFFHRSGVIFDSDGTVVLCNSMFDCPVGKFGKDFSDGEGLVKLLNTDEVNAVYSHITSYPLRICVDCELYTHCRGGCPIMWTVYNPKEVVHSMKGGAKPWKSS